MNKFIVLGFAIILIAASCSQQQKDCLDKQEHKNVKRIGQVVKLKKEYLDEYKRLHADTTPGVRDLLRKYHIRNFNIFLVQLADGDYYEFAYYEYWGDNYEKDMGKLDNEPRNQNWLRRTDPMQEGITEDQKGWKVMERIYFNY
ncbi:MAG: L-rhamnose mutarotase [Bacteroidales bacterium]|nr:L-rhamnose mutarotase [Bacteroidales bacterium]MBS3775122.1 L-rhamnose mutarotase [Bacteroidales bacterium]